jgi:hypothetical protein
MARRPNYLLVAALIVIIVQALAFSGVGRTLAQDVQSAMSSAVQLAEPASTLVTLNGVKVSGGDGWDFRRVMPDGSYASGYYRVPAGKVLVITDVDWQFNSTSSPPHQTLRLWVEKRSNTSVRHKVFESTIRLEGTSVDIDGGTSESMRTGFAVSSAGNISVDIWPGGGNIIDLVLRGYLTEP